MVEPATWPVHGDARGTPSKSAVLALPKVRLGKLRSSLTAQRNANPRNDLLPAFRPGKLICLGDDLPNCGRVVR